MFHDELMVVRRSRYGGAVVVATAATWRHVAGHIQTPNPYGLPMTLIETARLHDDITAVEIGLKPSELALVLAAQSDAGFIFEDA